MIEFVYGAKGSGKTKKMIDMANAEVGSPLLLPAETSPKKQERGKPQNETSAASL